MSPLGGHLHLFKAPWVSDPALLADRIGKAKVSDRFTAELAAWCAEIHEHLRELAAALDIELMLMGGNGASLRFHAVEQRGSRDNDYLTVATRDDIKRLMQTFGERFAALPDGLMQPERYEPKRPVRELDMRTYVIPVPLLLDHGYATNNNVKVELHFERRLPPRDVVSGALGPAAAPTMTAALPELPYQIGLKLMTLAADPVGIDETTRAASVPRQLYDLDLLLTGLTAEQWPALVDYVVERYAEECAHWQVDVAAGEPHEGIRQRLEHWAACLDETRDPWRTIHVVQQSGLQRPVHRPPWGWRARACRLIVVTECLRRGPAGYEFWALAGEVAKRVPRAKARPWRPALAALAGADPGALPVELADFVWDPIASGAPPDLEARVRRADALIVARR